MSEERRSGGWQKRCEDGGKWQQAVPGTPPQGTLMPGPLEMCYLTLSKRFVPKGNKYTSPINKCILIQILQFSYNTIHHFILYFAHWLPQTNTKTGLQNGNVVLKSSDVGFVIRLQTDNGAEY